MKRFSLIQRNKSKGLNTYYARIFDTVTKSVTYKSLGTTKKYEAQIALDELKNSLETPLADLEKSKGALIDVAICDYFKHLEAEFVAGVTVTNRRHVLEAFQKWARVNQISRLGECTPQMAGDFLTLNYFGRKPSTYRKYLTYLKTFFSWSLDVTGAECKNPFYKIRIKAGGAKSVEREFWSVEEIEQILDHAQSAQRRLFWAFMAWAGLRYSEAENLAWEDLDGGKIRVFGKGGKYGFVSISCRLQSEIDRFFTVAPETVGGAPRSGKIFHLYDRNTERNGLSKAAKDAKVSGRAFPHKFRHSFASNLLKLGASIVETSKAMRHESVNITLQYYAHCLNDDIEKAVNLL